MAGLPGYETARLYSKTRIRGGVKVWHETLNTGHLHGTKRYNNIQITTYDLLEDTCALRAAMRGVLRPGGGQQQAITAQREFK